ncbi:acyltransferase [Marinifilum sp. D714]|uniref:acyltransferase family protein n=1 Tax=Marinifilum sp. D714 TaxID=2937523 RepID=UPI0027C5BFFF|nr:acyltransferase [Marinifilum sp. D714]MDQ2178073.1 acyltransferase [Marinifilum sp. D714]
MTTTERRYDIDWLRVITIGLLLIYHIAIVFQPWAPFIGFIKSDTSLESIWIPMSMLNIWRIPLLFFVSGMGVCFAMRKRTTIQLLQERSIRILVPFLFGMFCIVPLHFLIWKNYYNQDLAYQANPSHLWFLGNIFAYVLILLPLFLYMKKNHFVIKSLLNKLFKTPLGLFVMMIPFVLEAILINPNPFELYAMTLHGFILGFLAFFFGFVFILAGETLRRTLIKWKWLFLILAAGLYTVRLVIFQLQSPNYLMTIESNLWIFAVFGFSFQYLNKSSNILTYLSEAAYPIYIIHMVILYAASYLILPLGMPAFLNFVIINLITLIGCFALYELVIKRNIILRPLFGLKINLKNKPALKLQT